MGSQDMDPRNHHQENSVLILDKLAPGQHPLMGLHLGATAGLGFGVSGLNLLNQLLGCVLLTTSHTGVCEAIPCLFLPGFCLIFAGVQESQFQVWALGYKRSKINKLASAAFHLARCHIRSEDLTRKNGNCSKARCLDMMTSIVS